MFLLSASLECRRSFQPQSHFCEDKRLSGLQDRLKASPGLRWTRGSCVCAAEGQNAGSALLRTSTDGRNTLRCEDFCVDYVWNVMALAQKPDFVFRRNGRVHLNRQGRQSSRLLAAEVWASAVVMLDTPCSEVVWRVLATYSIRQFPLRFPSCASPCTTTFLLGYTNAASVWQLLLPRTLHDFITR
jgi:hypothetical protein